MLWPVKPVYDVSAGVIDRILKISYNFLRGKARKENILKDGREYGAGRGEGIYSVRVSGDGDTGGE